MDALAERFADRQARTAAYARAWAPYVWPVGGVDDLKVSPFHLLASEGRVWFDHDHLWHMAVADRLAGGGEGVVAPTRWRTVTLADEAACTEAIAWWEAMTDAGGEGIVVKPRDFVARGRKGLVQPALKVAHPAGVLQLLAYGPDVLRLERRLGPDDAPCVPRLLRRAKKVALRHGRLRSEPQALHGVVPAPCRSVVN